MFTCLATMARQLANIRGMYKHGHHVVTLHFEKEKKIQKEISYFSKIYGHTSFTDTKEMTLVLHQSHKLLRLCHVAIEFRELKI
jgi:hypothetical protein